MRPDIVSRMVIFFVYYAWNWGHATPTATGAKARGVARTGHGESHQTGAARERRVGPAVSARRAAETRQLFSRCESLNAKWRREDVRSLACCPLKLTSYTRSFRSEQYDPHAAVRFPFSSFIVCEKGGDFKMQAADVRASQQHRMPHEHTRTPHAKGVLTVCGH